MVQDEVQDLQRQDIENGSRTENISRFALAGVSCREHVVGSKRTQATVLVGTNTRKRNESLCTLSVANLFVVAVEKQAAYKYTETQQRASL